MRKHCVCKITKASVWASTGATAGSILGGVCGLVSGIDPISIPGVNFLLLLVLSSHFLSVLVLEVLSVLDWCSYWNENNGAATEYKMHSKKKYMISVHYSNGNALREVQSYLYANRSERMSLIFNT